MKSPRTEKLASGHYAKHQLFSKDRLIAWSHQSRFRMARKLLTPYAGGRLLDYGCGDGTFLALNEDLFPQSVGVGIDPKEIEACRSRISKDTNIEFEFVGDLLRGEHPGKFQVITCMEVLEHCTRDTAEVVLNNLERLLATGGVLLVSVPNETGASLLVKQTARRLAGWRGIGDYRHTEKYTWSELIKMTLAQDSTSIDRPVYKAEVVAGSPEEYHGHKGFNWRLVRQMLAKKFVIKKVAFSPTGLLNGALSSQVFFVCVKKSA